MKTAHRMSARAKHLQQMPAYERANSLLRVLGQTERIPNDDIEALDASLVACLTAITQGRGTTADAAVVHAACQTCLEFEAQGLDSGHLPDLQTAYTEIRAAIARNEQGKALLLTGPGIAATQTMADVHLAFLRQCTRALWAKVLHTLRERGQGALVLGEQSTKMKGH